MCSHRAGEPHRYGHRHEVPPEAARQDGVFTSAQAVAHGLRVEQVRYRIRSGHWHRVAGRGLTAGECPPGGRPARALAWAAQLTWPDAVIGYRVAAALHGFPIDLHGFPIDGAPTSGRSPHPGAVPLVEVLAGRRLRPCGGVVAHSTRLPREQILRLPGGLQVTSPARTAVDCLATLDLEQAWDLLAWLTSRRVIGRDTLRRYLRDRSSSPGTAQLRTLHEHSATGAASPGECRLHGVLRTGGLTGWQAGARVFGPDGLIGVVDVLFPEQRLVIELDGFRAHSSRDAFIRDRRRQNRLLRAGYLVLRFTWWDLTQRPDAVLAEIREALSRSRFV